MNLQAKFWKYEGNHSAGRNCERKDPHGFGLDLISYVEYVEYVGFQGDYQSPLTYNDTQKIKVIRHKGGNDFGREITVSAPTEVWEKAALALWKVKELVG